MNKFFAMLTAPFSNPAKGIEKTTNELPAAAKAETKSRKRQPKKTAKRNKKTIPESV